MVEYCPYCLSVAQDAPIGAGLAISTCGSCSELADEVLEEISQLLHEARGAGGFDRLSAPLFERVGRDARLTPANVSVLIALGVRPSQHDLLFIGVASAERVVAQGRRAV